MKTNLALMSLSILIKDMTTHDMMGHNIISLFNVSFLDKINQMLILYIYIYIYYIHNVCVFKHTSRGVFVLREPFFQ